MGEFPSYNRQEVLEDCLHTEATEAIAPVVIALMPLEMFQQKLIYIVLFPFRGAFTKEKTPQGALIALSNMKHQA